MKEHVRKQLASDRHVEIIHLREVRLRPLAGHVALLKDHLFFGSVLLIITKQRGISIVCISATRVLIPGKKASGTCRLQAFHKPVTKVPPQPSSYYESLVIEN